jgi:hypothetical protein
MFESCHSDQIFSKPRNTEMKWPDEDLALVRGIAEGAAGLLMAAAFWLALAAAFSCVS